MSSVEIIAFIWFSIVIVGGTLLVLMSLRGRSKPDPGASTSPSAEAAPGAAAQVPRHLIPESRFVEVDGAKLHYVQAGAGSDVVLLHGIGASVFIWRFIFPLLELKHRVTAIDLAGFGKSSKNVGRDYGLDAQAALVAAALGKIGIERADLVGSSMGGTIALWLARQEPRRFARIAALAPASERSLVPASFQHFSATAAIATPFLRRALNRRTMRVILGRVLARRALITDAVVDSYLEPFLDRGESVRAFWAALSLIRDPRLPSSFEGLGAKVLLIYGERDLMVPRAAMERLLRLLPNAKLLTNADGGHHIMEDEPEWTARALEEFFAG